MDLLLIGHVIRAHGLRGEVLVEPYHAASPLWRAGSALFAVPGARAGGADRVEAEPTHTLPLRACRPQLAHGQTRYLCHFEGVADRTGAEALRGLALAIARDALPPPGEDEFYHHELVGYAVVDRQGRTLGTVQGILAAPAQDLIEVAPPRPAAPGAGDEPPETWYLPFVGAIVLTIDRAEKTIVVDPPEGLVP